MAILNDRWVLFQVSCLSTWYQPGLPMIISRLGGRERTTKMAAATYLLIDFRHSNFIDDKIDELNIGLTFVRWPGLQIKCICWMLKHAYVAELNYVFKCEYIKIKIHLPSRVVIKVAMSVCWGCFVSLYSLCCSLASIAAYCFIALGRKLRHGSSGASCLSGCSWRHHTFVVNMASVTTGESWEARPEYNLATIKTSL